MRGAWRAATLPLMLRVTDVHGNGLEDESVVTTPGADVPGGGRCLACP